MADIYLDGGHGGIDSGASYGGYLEKDWTLDIDNRLADLINKQNGLTLAGRTRTGDTTVDPNPRARRVKNSGAKYCISSHVNAGGGEGAETIHSIYSNTGRELAELILEELGKIGLDTRKAFGKKGSNGDYYFMHRQTGAVTTVIVEYGFIDTEKDREFLAKASNRQKCAEAVVKAICRLEEISFNGNAVEKKKTDSLYRVRKSWGNAKSQLGAFSILDNAIDLAEKNNGYNVYDENGNLVSSSSKTNNKASGNKVITEIQSILNSRYNTGIAVDGIYGSRTKKALIKGYQTELNKQFGANLNVDGIWGPKTRAATVTVRKGARGNLTYILQAALYCHGYDPKYVDGIFGNGTEKAVKQFQSDNGLSVDGVPGKNIFEKLFK